MSSAPFEEGYDSGYNSADTGSRSPEVYFTRAHLRFLNAQLSKLPPQDILRWCITSLPSLYQETAFGLTGLVTLDILSKLSSPVDLIFLNTLHHFDETLQLVGRVQKRYPHTKLHIYKPLLAETADDFAERYGRNLWESNADRYDWTAKVEPSERAYSELGVKAVLTGRRRAQGGARKNLDVLEVDETGLIKVNPLANWTFEQVEAYIKEHDVPYNVLLDRGYKSVGDWHSTQPVAAGEDERAGRWKGQQKTECGIHNPKSRYAQFLLEQELKAKAQNSTESPSVAV